jgi:hypothetical protein
VFEKLRWTGQRQCVEMLAGRFRRLACFFVREFCLRFSNKSYYANQKRGNQSAEILQSQHGDPQLLGFLAVDRLRWRR